MESEKIEKPLIPAGMPKSGRFWKTKQTQRFSSMKREGVLKFMSKPLEAKQAQKRRDAVAKALEAQMRDESKRVAMEKRARILENQQRRMANEFKNASYQTINTEKLKGMSKKQLRQVKKTSMNKNGQVELVGLYGAAAANTPAAKAKGKGKMR
jgi:rRNA-processing protein CGR1